MERSTSLRMDAMIVLSCSNLFCGPLTPFLLSSSDSDSLSTSWKRFAGLAGPGAALAFPPAAASAASSCASPSESESASLPKKRDRAGAGAPRDAIGEVCLVAGTVVGYTI